MRRLTIVAVATVLTLNLIGAGTVVAGDETSNRRHVRGARAPITGMTVYEVTESVQFDPVQGIVGPAVCAAMPQACLSRDATATLLGFARLGTPLCPMKALLTNPHAETCTILGTGFDVVPLATGVGSVWGTLTAVVNAPGNSSVHVPDLAVLTATFTGTIDLSAAFMGIPLGFIRPAPSNVIKIKETGEVVPFTATFRLPFAHDTKGHRKKIETEEENAFYLADDGSLIPVRSHERDLGFPTVRIEVDFVP
jgi:hypothetical protein